MYYAERGDVLIVLLAGVDKSTQARDEKTAIPLADNLQERFVLPKTVTKASAKTKTVPYDVAEQLRTHEIMAAHLDA